jgi:hypothetical protein
MKSNEVVEQQLEILKLFKEMVNAGDIEIEGELV